MTTDFENPIVSLVSRVLSPFIMLFALYVIFHGHYSPGGGFQGGTMLAAAILLVRLSSGSEVAQLQLKRGVGTILGSFGVLIYFGTGFLCLLLGGKFLDYELLARILPVSKVMAHNWGILFVEIGVGIAVMGLLVAIYDDLLEGDPDA
ncbi:MAG: sodium:proton antiporter [Candidatus Aminicenantes bacterium]|nr:sodium:proton antiporter [Candidatus Aminicenantes bacterium]